MIDSTRDHFPISQKLNILLFVLMTAALWGLLWTASHVSLLWALLAAVLFAHLNNGVFSLMHEAVHGLFSNNSAINNLFGIAAAALFPTSFTLQRIAHLGHHRRNRTDQELYDYYLPGQSRLLRNFQLYAGNLFGLYWLCIPLSNLIYLLTPWLYTSRWFIRGPARHLGFEPYVKDIAQQGIWTIWLECLWALVYQLGIWVMLDLNWQGWLLCYGFFALHWSVLQYADHAWSARDVVNGAWNLKTTALARILALNYHYHLAHHQYPDVPWLHLPRLVENAQDQPSFWKIYFSLLGGVKPAPPMGSKATL